MSVDVRIGSAEVSLAQLDERSREIFRHIVDQYLATGEPVGSRHISRLLPMTLSPASVRNVMADLEALGLVYAPHTSAGRLPTELGLRFFVDALLEIGDLAEDERRAIDAQVKARARRQYRDRAERGIGAALRLVARRRRGHRRQHQSAAQARRVRAARADAGAGGAGLGRRAGGEPAARRCPPTCPPRRWSRRRISSTRGCAARRWARCKAELEQALTAARAELDELTQRIVAVASPAGPAATAPSAG